MSEIKIANQEKTFPSNFPQWPYYSQDEINAVVKVLESGQVNQWTGRLVKNFEQAFAKTFQQPYAVAVANGSLALDLALKVADISSGDEVIVTPRSFIASASCVVLRGATPVFADVDAITQNITPETIEPLITDKTKAIIPVHLNGYPCDMPAIMDLANEHNLFVIEDCAQAHGAQIKEKPIGSFGHAAAFSFCQDKIMSTGGEGGMLLLNSEKDWQKAWSFKDHGKDYDTVFKDHPPGFRWVHQSIGTNWRMTEVQAVIGIKQLEKLPHWLARRTTIAQKLHDCLSPYQAIESFLPPPGIKPAWYRFSFHVNENRLNAYWDRKKVMAAIQAEGIPCLEICPEIYKEKAFETIDCPTPNCPTAQTLSNKVCVLLTHPTINDQDLELILNGLKKVINQASRCD